MAKFDNVDLGGDATMKRMIKREQDQRDGIARMAAEFGFKARERGDNMEKMLVDLQTLLSAD